MVQKRQHIVINERMKKSSFAGSFIILFVALSFIICGNLQAQVISNNGAAVSVVPGAVVVSKDLENRSGSTLGNNGTITLSGDFTNLSSGTTNGNGYYNLKGSWTNNGTFVPGLSTVTFNGSINQFIYHGSLGETFYYLNINNPGNIITQLSSAGGSLSVLKDLNITAGRLSLGPTTLNLNVSGKAAIGGSLTFSGTSPQTTTISDNLSGTGVIDMSGNSLPHLLNLAGATNTIGTLTTSPFGASTVDYNGTNQTAFPSANYRNLIISNSGTKVLQGSSLVGIDLQVNGGTVFDLGSLTSTLGVGGNTSIVGSLLFNSGASAKTVNLTGNLSGTGSIDMSGGDQAHRLNLSGALNSIGTFTTSLTGQSTVDYRNGSQTMFSSNNYRNLITSGGGIKYLTTDITASGVLTMTDGNIKANGFILKLTNSSPGAIVHTLGSVVGKLQRAIGTQGSEYLYPVGTLSNYNPLKLKFQNLTSGPLTAEFKPLDIGPIPIPLDDDGNEIYDTYSTGYWTLNTVIPMASIDFNANAGFNGFTGVDKSASIIKRTDGGSIGLDGIHDTVDVVKNEIARKNLDKGISSITTDIAIGRGRPRVVDPPMNIDICEGSDAYFLVRARGRGTLTYQWYVNDGTGWVPVVDGVVYGTATYQNSTTKRLEILSAPYAMNGLRYRVIITDGQGHPNTSAEALLTVNKIPIATATIPAPECPGVPFETIVLGTSNGVTGTTFRWTVTYPSGLTQNFTSTPGIPALAIGDVINGTFTNTTDAPLKAIFRIVPTGPATTFCIGQPIYDTVVVNPIPRAFVLPANSLQCDSTATNIRLTSPSTFTSGLVTFKYTVTTNDRFNVSFPGSVTGFVNSTNLPNNHIVADVLANQTDAWQNVIYRVVPVSPVGCADGPSVNAVVKVNPTPRAVPLNSIKPAICYGGTSEITLTTPSVMTSGSIKFDYTISFTGVPGDITGNSNPENDKLPGDKLIFQYRNSAPPSRIDSVNSVRFAIRPKVVSMDNGMVCNAGRIVVPEVQVHPKTIKYNYPLTNGTGILVTKPLTCTTPVGSSSLAALKVIVTKGADQYHVSWTGPFGFPPNDSIEISNIRVGKYTVSVIDNLGCRNDSSYTVKSQTANPILTPTVILPGINVSCPEGTNGSVSLFVTGGSTYPYSFTLIRNTSEIIRTGLLTQNFVFGDTNTYKTYTGLRSGAYTLAIKDINGCEVFKNADLREPLPITVSFEKSDRSGFNVSCRGYNDGWAKATPSGGNGSYTYLWYAANGVPLTVSTNSELLDSIPAGKYYLLTRDLLNCSKLDSVTLVEPDGMQLLGSEVSMNPDGNKNISCSSGSNGYIKLNIGGGSGVYNYFWTGPGSFTANTKDISGLVAGTYVATVKDNNNCLLKILPGSTLPTFTLTEPTPIVITGVVSKSADQGYNINCYGGNTGSINITAAGGGIGTYIYNWSTADGTGIIDGQKDQSGLTAGTYTLRVTDSNGCVAIKVFTLTQPPLFGTVLKGNDITCQSPGFNNGSIVLTVTGGVAPFTYSWSNGAATKDINGLVQGKYKVTVTYNNTCQRSDSVTISLPPVLTYSKTVTDYNGFNVSCYGLSDGSIKITPTSGVAPYIYSWVSTNGFTGTSQDITGIKAGQYVFNIMDNNYCKATEVITITEPGKLDIGVTLSSSNAGGFNINCAGASTGTIDLNPINPVKSVNYLWADGIFGKSRKYLTAGTYDIVIKDANNCYAAQTITLTQPDTIKLKFDISKPFCPDKPNGEIRLKMTGGVIGTDYTYKWSDNSTGRTLSNIPKGYYKVTVSDMNGCTVKDSVIVTPLNETCLIIPNAISPNGDLINDVWNIGEKELYPLMEIKVFNRWGEAIWKSEKGYPNPWDGTSNGVKLPIDSYHYTIDLHNGTKPLVGNITIVR